MHIAQIRKLDITNGEGLRVSVFVSGCYFHCHNCFNQKAQDFSYGEKYTYETKAKILEYLNKPYIHGLSLLGGDPMCQGDDTDLLIDLCQAAHRMGKNVWLWTGYTFEELESLKDTNLYNLLLEVDVLVDGRYEEEKRNLNLRFRGSENQRIIYLKKGKIQKILDETA